MRSASIGFLIDSSVLIYLHDPRDPVKRARAFTLVDELIVRSLAVLSVQCLTEFFHAVRWKLPQPLSHDEALRQVDRLSRACQVVSLDPSDVVEACRATESYHLAFWDALIWAVARKSGVSGIFTEDIPSSEFVGGMRYLNPVSDSFNLSQALAL